MEEPRQPRQYEIRVRGVLGDTLLSAFPELHARMRDRETVLAGVLADQAALHGILGRIEALGLELLEVRRQSARTESRAPRASSGRGARGSAVTG